MPLKSERIVAILIVGFWHTTSNATVTETYSKALWQNTVQNWTTIDFTGWPNFTSISSQYASQGVLFTDNNDYILSSSGAFPNDGKGLNSNEGFGLGQITCQFNTDMYWFAVDHPTPIIVHLYYRGMLMHTTDPFYDTISRFAGIISTEPFDKAVILTTSGSSVAIDDLFFGTIPAPGALGLLGLAALMPRRRRLD